MLCYVPPPANFHVMIVDDDVSVRDMLTELFRTEGFETSACADGHAALAAANTIRPDLVLLDYRMPGMDGLDVCRRLREKYDELDAPIIIMMTGNVAEKHKTGQMQRGFMTGANDYFIKPFELDNLLARVRSWLRLKQVQNDLARQVIDRQRQLAREQDYNQAILAAMADALLVIDSDGIIRKCNKRAGELLGYVENSLPGQSLEKLLSKNRSSIADIPLAKILTHDTHDLDVILHTLDNRRVPVSISSAHMPAAPGSNADTVLVIRDISERKRLQQEQRNYALKLEAEVEKRTREIRNTEERYRTLFKSIDQPLMVSDMNSTVSDCNKACETFTGLTHEQVIGMNACQVLCKRVNCPGYREIMDRVNLIGSHQHECLALGESGTEKPITIIVSTISSENNDLQQMLWIVIDRSEHEEMEAMAARTREYARHMLERMGSYRHMVGRSRKFQQVLEFVKTAAAAAAPVLILGRSGTGKEVTARAIHNASERREKPFVILDCATVQASLLESELFGHEKGAFTGAATAKPGIVEIADNGTLFVDEIGEMPLPLQAKLLRVLERGEFRRLGSVQDRKVDLRVISATNRDLEVEVRRKKFRQDLFFRLNVLSITLPNLRERKEDIPMLAQHCLDTSKVTMGSTKRIRNDAMAMLQKYDWPGNIRELGNVIERAVILSGSNRYITAEHLPPELRKKTAATLSLQPVISLEQAEADCVSRALAATGNSQTEAAKLLGISRMTLWRKMQKHGLGK